MEPEDECVNAVDFQRDGRYVCPEGREILDVEGAGFGVLGDLLGDEVDGFGVAWVSEGALIAVPRGDLLEVLEVFHEAVWWYQSTRSCL